jgi:hypothetical protein
LEPQELKLEVTKFTPEFLKALALTQHEVALMDTVLGSLVFSTHAWAYVAGGPLNRVDCQVVEVFRIAVHVYGNASVQVGADVVVGGFGE